MKWYKKEIDEIYKKLNSSINGLNSNEVSRRLEKYGKNELPKKNNNNIFLIFISEFYDPIIWLLIISIIFSFIVKEYIDAFVIISIILIDAIVGTLQEWKANKSAQALQDLIKVNVKVIRYSQEIEIDSSDLTIGDIVLLEPGNKISADLRIIESRNLTVNESVLTGESINSIKFSDVIDEDCNISDRKNMVFAGTNVITGRAKAIVCEIGKNTEIGKIANNVIKTKETKSPLTIRMEKFSKQISILVIIIGFIISFLLYKNGNDFKTIFLAVIALSVSAMPEGLPLALTMALTIGSNRMSKKNVIVKKLNSVESLGSCTVIASDKTGTLTINEQTAKKIVLPNGDIFKVDGIGYNDSGKVSAINNSNIEDAKYISKLGYMNNEANLYFKNNKWNYIGDSIDIAFLALGKKLKIDKFDNEIIGSIPYESENKYSAVFYEEKDNIKCTVKGSLEKILEFCDYININGKKEKIDKEIIIKQNEDLANEGYRVIAIADGIINNFVEKNNYDSNDIESLIFIGLIAFIDPIRTETINSILDCKKAGIKVVMITGDHPLTALSIAKELNIATSNNEITTGSDIEKFINKNDNAFDKFIKDKTVFARVTPLQKLKIIESFKRQKEFIAVTGDGVNDAPAIKSANIGIAMGSGTDVAKETASMIIIDDNFLSIVEGIKEGKNAYKNIRKIVYFLLSCGLAEVLFFVLATVFKMEMPLLSIQLLWLNVVTDGLQDLALSFENEKNDIMKELPRKTNESIFDRMLISEILISGLTIGLIVFTFWCYLINNINMEINHARGYIMTLMVFIQNIHVLNCRSEKRSTFKISLKSNYFILISIISAIGLQFIIMENDFLSKLLNTYSIPLNNMLYLFILALPVLFIMEIYKKIRRG